MTTPTTSTTHEHGREHDPQDAAFHGHASQGSEEVPSATRKQSILTGKRGESEKRDADDSKKREASQCVTRHAKRARTSALSSGETEIECIIMLSNVAIEVSPQSWGAFPRQEL